MTNTTTPPVQHQPSPLQPTDARTPWVPMTGAPNDTPQAVTEALDNGHVHLKFLATNLAATQVLPIADSHPADRLATFELMDGTRYAIVARLAPEAFE